MWTPLGKELLIRPTVFTLYVMSFCSYGHFQFWFRGQDLGSDRVSSWSLLTVCFFLFGAVMLFNVVS